MIVPQAKSPDICLSRSPGSADVAIWGALEQFHPSPPEVRYERILRIQGYSDLTRVRPVIRRTAEAMASTAQSLGEPAVAFRHVRVRSLDAGKLELQDGTTLQCEAFGRQLAGCTEVVPFVLTAGAAVSVRVVELVEAGDLLEGVLLETAGWLAIEDATRQFKSFLREASLGRGQRITSRMGPGYSYKMGNRTCMWALEEQPKLFGLLGEGELPVTLMQSCAMNPKMSRSGMYGIAPLLVTNSGSRAGNRRVPESTEGSTQ